MNEEIKEILDRLERIDHKVYSCGFEFADSGSFDEDCRCFEERKKLANHITYLEEINKRILTANKKLAKDSLNLQKENERKDNVIVGIENFIKDLDENTDVYLVNIAFTVILGELKKLKNDNNILEGGDE